MSSIGPVVFWIVVAVLLPLAIIGAGGVWIVVRDILRRRRLYKLAVDFRRAHEERCASDPSFAAFMRRVEERDQSKRRL